MRAPLVKPKMFFLAQKNGPPAVSSLRRRCDLSAVLPVSSLTIRCIPVWFFWDNVRGKRRSLAFQGLRRQIVHAEHLLPKGATSC